MTKEILDLIFEWETEYSNMYRGDHHLEPIHFATQKIADIELRLRMLEAIAALKWNAGENDE